MGNVVLDTIPYTVKLDYSGTDTVIYQGWASPGANTGSSVWRIAKYTYSGGTVATDIQHANGNTQFSNVWDQRGSGTYS